MKSMGPRMEPWGTPITNLHFSDLDAFTLTEKLLTVTLLILTIRFHRLPDSRGRKGAGFVANIQGDGKWQLWPHAHQ